MQDNQKEILTKFWWEHVRFASFGQQLAGKLNADPALMQEFRNLFKAQHDKLSYYDLFQFIEHRL